MVNFKQFTVNLFRENTTVMWSEGRKDCVVVDPGFYSAGEHDAFFGFLTENDLHPAAILLTHGHIDHIFGVAETARRYGCGVWMSQIDRQEVEWAEKAAAKLGLNVPDGSFSSSDVTDGDVIEAAGFRFKAITTPGHSMGSVCYLEETEQVMFTGDTLFAGTIGRTDMFFSDYDKEIVSIMDKLMILDAGIEIIPGHGGKSTIGYERMNNPFLEPFNEPEEKMDEEEKED